MWARCELSEAHERCWRCGHKSKIDKCHVIPAALGGNVSAYNLVCSVADPIAKRRTTKIINTCEDGLGQHVSYSTTHTGPSAAEKNSRSCLVRKATRLARRPGPEGSNLIDAYTALMSIEFTRAVIHFCEGRLNPSTIACVLAEIENPGKSSRRKAPGFTSRTRPTWINGATPKPP